MNFYKSLGTLSLYFTILPLLFFNALGFSNQGLLKQLDEDFQNITPQFHASNLHAYFKQKSAVGWPLIYISVRKNHFSYEESPSVDTWRTYFLKRYFGQLATTTNLPNVDFLICTPDGLSCDFEFPVFGFSVLEGSHRNACLFPNFEILNPEVMQASFNYISESENSAPWENKKEIVFFRGAGTGWNLPEEPFCGNHRARLMVYSFHNPDLVDAKIIRNYYPKVAEIIHGLGLSFGGGVSFQDFFKYKYLIDVEGNAAGYARPIGLLFSNCTMLKMESKWTQWYDHCLIPYENYVPVKTDLSDLKDIIMYLRENDDIAHQIAINGQLLAKEIFSRQMIDWYILEMLHRLSEREILDR